MFWAHTSKEVLTWYLEKIIRWGRAATREQEITANMQRDFLRERPDGISGGQPDLTDKSAGFSRAYDEGRNLLHAKIKAVGLRLQICWYTPRGKF